MLYFAISYRFISNYLELSTARVLRLKPILMNYSTPWKRYSCTLLDRSLTAWGIISQNNQFNTDGIFDLMLQLMRLQNNINAEFPDMQNFIWLGLDE